MTAETRAELFDYYLAELAELREGGAGFAARFPQAAQALGLGEDGAHDHDVERLLEGFAYVAARLQRNLDRQLPRLASALLDTLHPHMTAPTPSFAIAEFRVDPERARLAHGFRLPRGAQLLAETDVGAVVRLRTAWDVELWPLAVETADRPDPALFAFLDGRGEVPAALRVRIRALGGQSLRDALPDRLRLRLGGPLAVAAALRETLLTLSREVWVQFPSRGDEPPAPLTDRAAGRAVRLAAPATAEVGFAPEEALAPHPPHAHAAHRLAREFFAFPEKFMFIDVLGLRAAAAVAEGGWLDLVFVLDAPGAAPAGAERTAFRLGATPVVNLFSRISEPIRLDPARSEHRLIPDLRFERSTEVHTVERVTLTSANARDGAPVAPFFAFEGAPGAARDLYWTARRAPAARGDMSGSDVHLTFRDRAFAPRPPQAQVAFAQLSCTSRGLAQMIDPGQRLALEVDAPVEAVVCATRPTPQIAAPEPGADLWRLVSHLSADRLSFAEGPQAAAHLREALRLYAPALTPGALAMIDGVVELTSSRVAARVGAEAWRGWTRGLDIALTLSPEAFIGGAGHVFGAVMARYFALYAGANSFAQLTLRREGREGDWARWPPMSGERIVA